MFATSAEGSNPQRFPTHLTNNSGAPKESQASEENTQQTPQWGLSKNIAAGLPSVHPPSAHQVLDGSGDIEDERSAAIAAWRFGPRWRLVKSRAEGCHEDDLSVSEEWQYETKSLVYVTLPKNDPAWERTWQAHGGDPNAGKRDDLSRFIKEKADAVGEQAGNKRPAKKDKKKRLAKGAEKPKRDLSDWSQHSLLRGRKVTQEQVQKLHDLFARHPAAQEQFTGVDAFERCIQKHGADASFRAVLNPFWEAIYFYILRRAVKSSQHFLANTAHDRAANFAFYMLGELARGAFDGTSDFKNWMNKLGSKARDGKADVTGCAPNRNKPSFQPLERERFADDGATKGMSSVTDTAQVQRFRTEEKSQANLQARLKEIPKQETTTEAILGCLGGGMTQDEAAKAVGVSKYRVRKAWEWAKEFQRIPESSAGEGSHVHAN